MVKVLKRPKIGVLGLGYVGLPLAIKLSKNFETFGVDKSSFKVDAINSGTDPSQELDDKIISSSLNSGKLKISQDLGLLNKVDVIIVAVPTPIDSSKKPDLNILKQACYDIGQVVKNDSIIIFESTVYPGVTEDICVPIIEKSSNLIWKKDFYVGYSPERINPGDQVHGLENIVKIISGDSKNTAEQIMQIYSNVTDTGIYVAESIKIAEAAKVIENTQRDLNIALMNELSIIFYKANIDFSKVLEAAKTKWNFAPYTPGLVGGHCIGVDPYYLAYFAEANNFHPDVILSGRRTNEGMADYIFNQVLKSCLKNGLNLTDLVIDVVGLSYKENCSDLRNSKIFDVIDMFIEAGIKINITDTLINFEEIEEKYQSYFKSADYFDWTSDVVLVGVAHDELHDMEHFIEFLNRSKLVFDIKGTLSEKVSIPNYWSL